MNHPSIVNAFKNAFERKSDKIYMSFKRENLFYKDTYYILIGDRSQVECAIKKLYREVEEEKRDFYRADNNNVLDTPFDTWCDGGCICYNIQCGADLKCGTHWTHDEHANLEELNMYISNIHAGYYPNYTVEYM
jgi:hypothetical protein